MADTENIAFEAMLKEAVTANFRAKMRAMPPEEELLREYPPSAEHIGKMKALFAWERRRNAARKLLSFAKAAVIVLCAAATLTFALLMTNPQVRAAARDTIVQFFEGFTRIEFIEPAEPTKDARHFTPGYLPQGYALMNIDEYGDSRLTVYGDTDGNVLMLTAGPPGAYTLDAEYRSYREEIRNGVTYYVGEATSAGYDSVIIWEQGGFAFSITGPLPIDVLFQIAFSME